MRTGLTIVILAFFTALALRLALLFAAPDFNVIPPMEMERVAQSFAATGELANPYAIPTGPTAHVLPIYPMLLGTIYRVWGTGKAGRVAQGVFSCSLAALRCALLYPLVLYLGLGHRTALLSTALSTLYVPAFATEIRGGWEAPLAALFLMGLAFLIIRLIRTRELTWATAIGYGCYLGISALLSSALLETALGFIAAGAWFFRRQALRYLGWSAILFFAIVLLLTPWALRNRRQLGETVWLRSNLGFELWQAYRDGAGVGALDNDPRVGPALNPESALLLRNMGEVRYHEVLKQQAFNWIRSHPGESARLFIGHLLYFWFPPGRSILYALPRAMLTVVAVCGMGFLVSKRLPGSFVLLGIWLFFPLVYYVVYWSSRYRYPMEWTLVVAAAAALSALWSRYRQGSDSAYGDFASADVRNDS